jgi:hypothetical protein
MLLLEGYISNFTRARYYFLCVEFSDFYVNQSLAGQTIPYDVLLHVCTHVLLLNHTLLREVFFCQNLTFIRLTLKAMFYVHYDNVIGIEIAL